MKNKSEMDKLKKIMDANIRKIFIGLQPVADDVIPENPTNLQLKNLLGLMDVSMKSMKFKVLDESLSLDKPVEERGKHEVSIMYDMVHFEFMEGLEELMNITRNVFNNVDEEYSTNEAYAAMCESYMSLLNIFEVTMNLDLNDDDVLRGFTLMISIAYAMGIDWVETRDKELEFTTVPIEIIAFIKDSLYDILDTSLGDRLAELFGYAVFNSIMTTLRIREGEVYLKSAPLLQMALMHISNQVLSTIPTDEDITEKTVEYLANEYKIHKASNEIPAGYKLN